MAFGRQIDSLLAAIDFLTHAISDDFFVLDEVFHESNVGVISHDDIGSFHGLDGLRRHFFFTFPTPIVFSTNFELSK
ncbi:Uncharacterised protein [Bacteroides xylanisolvens]|nr:Uncharacterised protein [Bacteroides xylanisolvens]